VDEVGAIRAGEEVNLGEEEATLFVEEESRADAVHGGALVYSKEFHPALEFGRQIDSM